MGYLGEGNGEERGLEKRGDEQEMLPEWTIMYRSFTASTTRPMRR